LYKFKKEACCLEYTRLNKFKKEACCLEYAIVQVYERGVLS